MRNLLRAMVKTQMKKMGMHKINKRMRYSWRRIMGAYPTDTITGKEMAKDYHGRKEYRKGSYNSHLFFYNWKFLPAPLKGSKKLGRA